MEHVLNVYRAGNANHAIPPLSHNFLGVIIQTRNHIANIQKKRESYSINLRAFKVDEEQFVFST